MLPITIDSADVAPDGTVYAGKGASIYKSTDGGDNWTLIYTLPGSVAMTQRVFVDSRGYVYASGFASSDFGLYRSTDGGANWTRVIEQVENTCIWAIEEDANGDLYAGEYSRSGAGSAQIWKSTDGGGTWVQKYSHDTGASQDHIHCIRYHPASGYLYAAYGDTDTITIIRSVDGGENWTTVSSAGGRLLAMAILGDYVYIGSDTNSGNKIYRFTDDGSPSVTLETVYTFAASQDTQVFDAGEYGSKLFFCTWTPGYDGSVSPVVVVYDSNTDVWDVRYSVPHPIYYEGYWNSSRHHRDGVFYINNGNEKGIRFTP